ncbi:ribosomal rna assembly protein mis3 [Plasmopara halstedii]|uniref:Ribosomal rna assembly protein mis3 n=1 Tax=Plasmopara halstedii TaxID=4781 RepID=A0A0P1AWF4_PLAHL|nr:ribosomal rna assembly protein mis3 [Plasmopara halstedii]CEG46756.1 ribosomal rna assembly protein mis3 [Plasmopara halstedii]|eukprot:XP_024583125.1 ribosomal rna assembly protein mis3 [Plasmopara halstedii]
MISLSFLSATFSGRPNLLTAVTSEFIGDRINKILIDLQQNVQTKKPKKVREKKEYTPLSPATTANKAKKHEEKAQMLQKRKADKMAEYVAPSEKETNKKRRKQKTEAREINKLVTSVEALKQKFLSQKSTKGTMDSKAVSSASDYLAGSAKKNLKKANV